MTRKLKSLRAAFGFTQKEMSEKLGISETSYRDKENGKQVFTTKEANTILEVFKERGSNVCYEDIFMNEEA